MDTELARNLMDLKESMGRIDERTINIHRSQKDLRNALISHEERDRIDFDQIHGRVNRNDRKLNFLMGGVALTGFLIMAVIGLANSNEEGTMGIKPGTIKDSISVRPTDGDIKPERGDIGRNDEGIGPFDWVGGDRGP